MWAAAPQLDPHPAPRHSGHQQRVTLPRIRSCVAITLDKMSAPVQAAKKFTSFYRIAGLSYIDMLNTASTAMRKVLKEPLRTEALSKSNFKYREFSFTDGKENPGGEQRFRC